MATPDKKLTISDKILQNRISDTVEAGAYWLSVYGPDETRFKRELTNRQHRHTYYEFCLVRSGSGIFEHGQKKYPLKTGDLFIALPGVFHEISSFKTKDLVLDFCSFGLVPRQWEGQSRATVIIDHFLKDPLPYRKNYGFLASYVQTLRSLGGYPGQRSLYFRTELMKQFVLQAMDALTGHTGGTDSTPHPHTRDATLSKALHFLESNLHRNVEVCELSRHCGMSERNLRRLFQATYGHTIHYEIQNRRCLRAKTLLSMGDFTIKEVGHQIGIESPAQFSRWFTKWAECTPREFRNRSSANFLKAPGLESLETEFFSRDRKI